MRKVDKAFREFLKYAMYHLLFSNSWLDDLTAKALYDLTQVPEYQELITDLFLLMYKQKSFVTDTQSLTERIVKDYLESDYCLDNLSELVRDQALRDHTVVLPGLHYQLMKYLKTDFIYLSQLFEKLLINTAWMDSIQ